MSIKKVVVIGSGFSGIAAATTLASEYKYDVTVLEKNKIPGGRARVLNTQGFVFDMGPSWYWMPDVFDNYFKRFKKETTDYYQLKRLDPSYTIIFGENDFLNIPANLNDLYILFESLEQGSGKMLEKFLIQAAYKYKVGMNQLVYAPGRSLREFMKISLLLDILRMDIFQSFHSHIRKFFHNEKLLRIMEFPILFLGAVSKNTPALYSLMNYADIKLGTWYPMGGMYKIIEGMIKLAEEKGVRFQYGEEVKKIEVVDNMARTVVTTNSTYHADVVVANADYNFVETSLLDPQYQSYKSSYWESRTMAPSSLIFYLGINKKLNNLNHHNLFFDKDLDAHSKEIYENPKWPSQPLFYVCAASKTDATVAPEGKENLFVLMPVAPGLEDTPEIREKYYNIMMDRMEKLTGQSIRDSVIFKKSYAHQDFINDYHAFKGNAYGLANTLKQTAILKPSIKSKKINNLYYTGQLTVPGPGVPPSLISGQVVAEEVFKEQN